MVLGFSFLNNQAEYQLFMIYIQWKYWLCWLYSRNNTPGQSHSCVSQPAVEWVQGNTWYFPARSARTSDKTQVSGIPCHLVCQCWSEECGHVLSDPWNVCLGWPQSTSPVCCHGRQQLYNHTHVIGTSLKKRWIRHMLKFHVRHSNVSSSSDNSLKVTVKLDPHGKCDKAFRLIHDFGPWKMLLSKFIEEFV